MSERPILFSGPLVRAILSGAKTQTRRIVDPRIHVAIGHDWEENPDRIVEQSDPEFGAACLEYVPCRYGQPGDRLWVRETWLELDRDHWGDLTLPRDAIYNHPWPRVNACAYAADTDRHGDGEQARRAYGYRWRPSIHMPRWASRITLEVTGVRVERLQGITEEDARAEGVERDDFFDGWKGYGGECWRDTARDSFQSLWCAINGAESWGANPWVWVVSFKRIEEARNA